MFTVHAPPSIATEADASAPGMTKRRPFRGPPLSSRYLSVRSSAQAAGAMSASPSSARGRRVRRRGALAGAVALDDRGDGRRQDVERDPLVAPSSCAAARGSSRSRRGAARSGRRSPLRSSRGWNSRRGRSAARRVPGVARLAAPDGRRARDGRRGSLARAVPARVAAVVARLRRGRRDVAVVASSSPSSPSAAIASSWSSSSSERNRRGCGAAPRSGRGSR